MRRKRNDNGIFEVEEIVIDRRCDVPMASKKGLLPCEGGAKCLNCYACLEQIENGEWRHYDPLRGKVRYQKAAKW